MPRLTVRTLVVALAAFLFATGSASAQLPSGWSTRDIGAVGAAGSVTVNGSTFAINGAGADIWGYADGFRFAYTPLTGDGSIVARVAAVDHVHAWTKAGVMMRDTLAANARHAFMLTSAAKGHAFQRRRTTGGASTHTSGGSGAAPQWVKLTRAGSSFKAYKSVDGVSWTLVGSDTIAMGATIYAGVAVTSHYAGVRAAGAFDAVKVTAAPLTTVTTGSFSTSQPAVTSLRVVHWNVHHGGRRTDGVTDRDGLTTWMASFKADVFSLNELDSLSNLNDIVSRLKAKTGINWYYSYDYGIAVLSRFPIGSKSSCVINTRLGRKIVQAGIMVNGRLINIWSAHLDAYSSTTRQSEAKAVLACVAPFAEQKIVAGDFNAGASSTEIGYVKQYFVDAWAAAKALGATKNYSGNCDGCTRNGRIDYVFASKTATQLVLKSAQIFDTRSANGVMPSDHKPLLVVYEVK